MAPTSPANGFGSQTYWNRPAGVRASRRKSKYASIRRPLQRKSPAVPPPPRLPSPTPSIKSPQGRGILPSRAKSRSPSPTMLCTSNVRLPPSSLIHAEHKSKAEVDDAKDEKAILKLMKSTLPQFCNETDWELTIFELKLILARVWPHKDDMDIIEYMTRAIPYGTYTTDMEIRADNLIYYALTTSAKKGHMRNCR